MTRRGSLETSLLVGFVAIILLTCGVAGLCLRHYGCAVFRIYAATALSAAVLCHLFVRRALRPIHHLTDSVNRLSKQPQDMRLEPCVLPRELYYLCSALNTAVLHLNHGFQLLADHAQNVAHDFRSPLSNLRCQTEVLLLRPRTIAEYEQLLKSNLQEYDALSRMLDNVLLLGRLEEAGLLVNYTQIDLREQLQQALRQCARLAGQRPVIIRAGGSIRADPVLFRRAITNLLANALQYAPQDALVEVMESRTQSATLICVSHSGPTIAAEHRERIFDRFYRIEKSGDQSRESTGLGLAIVRSIMALHQGKVWVESGGGTTRFTLLFPDPAPCLPDTQPLTTTFAESAARSAPR